jgi:hypothetical protein
MTLVSNEPLEIIQQVRAAEHTKRASAGDFVAPLEKAPRHVEIPPPGVVHPTLLPLIAEAIGRTPSEVRATLEEDGVGPLATALAKVKSAELRRLGIAPTELLLRRLPIPLGSARPNVTPAGSGPVLSPLNAMLEMFDRECRSQAQLIKLRAPDVIVQHRTQSLQRRFEAILSLLDGRGLPFEAEHEAATNPPIPPELIIQPPSVGGWFAEPARPFSVLLERDTASVRYFSAIARIDLVNGDFSTHAVGEARLVRLLYGKALLARGSRLVVFDARRDSFTLEAPELPARLVLDACCGVNILDTRTRRIALMPGPLASSGFDVTLSACGEYGWIELEPRKDDVGIFSASRLERVFQPWPHPKLKRPAVKRASTEGHDGTARALVALEGGGFRLLYGRHVLDGPHAWELNGMPIVGAFDVRADRLLTLDETALTLHTLGPSGKPTIARRWSCDALSAHLAPELPLAQSGVDPGSLMANVGTTARLVGLSSEQLASLLYLAPHQAPRLEPVLEAARALQLPSRLRALS